MVHSMTAQTKRALVIGISEYEKTNDNAWGVIHGANDADLIISVLAEPEIRCERIIQRDGLTKESACERMNAQLPEEFFIQHSDYVVRNDGNLDSLLSGIFYGLSMLKSILNILL